MKKLSYRGIPYEHPSQFSSNLCLKVSESGSVIRRSYRGASVCIKPHAEPTEVPEKVVIQQLINRGVTHFRLIYQGMTLLINRDL